MLLIVEGDCDETLLIGRLKELFREHEIRFEPQNTDILFDFIEKNRPIKEKIGDKIKEILIKRKFKPHNIMAVIHIIDTDGCLIPNDRIIIDENQDVKTLYQSDHISVPDEKQKSFIRTRNEIRSRNIRTMNSTKIILKKYKMPYQIFYFSRHLEHVIFNEPNPTKETKVDNIESFIEDLTEPIENYLKQYMPQLNAESYDEQYEESWTNIAQGVESLNRSTNTPLIFDFIKSYTL